MRKAIFWMHLVCGIVVGAIIFIMSTTGAILAFEPQLVAWAERNVRVVEPAAVRLSLNDILASAQKINSKDKPTVITISNDPAASVAVGFGRKGTVYVNPYNGEALGGESAVHHFMHEVEVWHRYLGGKEKFKPLGHNVKAVCNIIFMTMIITGFYLWWPKSWTQSVLKTIMFFNPTAKGKVRDWNWHNVIGFWCAPWLIIITLTGLIMSYQWANNLLYKMAGSTPPPQRQNQPARDKNADEKFQAPSLDPIFALAQTQNPKAKSYIIRFPSKPDGDVSVTIETSAMWFPHQRSTLTVKPSTNEIVKWEPFEEESRGRKWRMIARYLHTGEAAGVVGQIIAFIAACGASVLVWTGFALAWSRFISWKSRKIQRS